MTPPPKSPLSPEDLQRLLTEPFTRLGIKVPSLRICEQLAPFASKTPTTPFDMYKWPTAISKAHKEHFVAACNALPAVEAHWKARTDIPEWNTPQMRAMFEEHVFAPLRNLRAAFELCRENRLLSMPTYRPHKPRLEAALVLATVYCRAWQFVQRPRKRAAIMPIWDHPASKLSKDGSLIEFVCAGLTFLGWSTCTKDAVMQDFKRHRAEYRKRYRGLTAKQVMARWAQEEEAEWVAEWGVGR